MKHKTIAAAGVTVPLICCGLIAGSAFAMQTANTEATLGVTLSAEQDDNITNNARLVIISVVLLNIYILRQSLGTAYTLINMG